MKTLAAALSGIAVLGTLACGSSEAPRQTSAGWTLSAEPIVSVGELDGADEYLFQSITDALLLSDGRLVVADDGTLDVRLFDSAGAFLSRWGGAGDGPGEYQNVRAVWRTSATEIGVYDARAHRLTYIDVDGAVVGTRPILPPTGSELPAGMYDVFVGAFADGSVALGLLAFGGQLVPGSIVDDRFIVARFDLDGVFAGTIGEEETFFERTGFSGGGGAPLPYTPIPYTAMHRDSIYMADGRRPEVEVRDGEGNVGRTITFPADRQDVEAAYAALAEEIQRRDTRLTVDNLNETPRSESIPYVGGLMVDSDGFLWVRGFDAPDDALWLSGGIDRYGGSWWVLSPQGDLVTTVAMPEHLRPIYIEGDRLVAVSLDDLEVQRVVVHTIER
jgi:hypothetical protein